MMTSLIIIKIRFCGSRARSCARSHDHRSCNHDVTILSIILHKTIDLLYLTTKIMFACTHVFLFINAHFRPLCHAKLL